MGLVATTVAIALGLLIASAKSFYDTQNADMTQLATNIVLLDRVLAHYGPETQEIRAMLRSAVANLVKSGDSSGKSYSEHSVASEGLFDKIQELSPQNDRQRSFQAQASGVATQNRPNALVDVRTRDHSCSHAIIGHHDFLA